MVFTTSVFLFLFLPVCLCLFFIARALEQHFEFASRHKLSFLILCFFSLIFYSFFKISNLLWILIFIAISYISGHIIEKARKNNIKKATVICSVSALIITLIVFKYSSPIFDITNSNISLVAPLGISFIVFSSISYIVDVYRGVATAGNFLETTLFITFFPKVVSGPIVLWKDFSKYLSTQKPNSSLILQGINRIAVGFAKKVIIADTLGLFVSECLKNLHQGIDVSSAWICLILYFFQIYIDFSSYSDISIGLANIFGFEFKENFNFPYISTSITEFWRRWHISLGNWFKEYVYIPLGGSRAGNKKTIINIAIVFILTGLWHGSGVLYLLWGVLHGICRIFEKLSCNTRVYTKTPSFIKWLFTTIVVMFGWSIFMLPNFGDFKVFYESLFGLATIDKPVLNYMYFVNIKLITILVISILGSYLASLKSLRSLQYKLDTSVGGIIVKEVAIIILFVFSIIFMINSTYSPFIYFQY